MSAQHTPGPWVIAESVGNKHTTSQMRRIRCANEGLEHGAICEVYGVRDGTIAAANATLIASAPDLLAALQTLERAIANNEPFSRTEHEQARAAIAKAKP